MLDFVQIKHSTKIVSHRNGAKEKVTRIFPEFVVMHSDDLMIKGSSFYAVWDEDGGMWSKDPGTVCRIVDSALREKAEDRSVVDPDATLDIAYLNQFSSKKWSEFLKYCASLPDNYHELDASLTFLDDIVVKEDYVSKRLPYALKAGSFDAWDKLVGTLYDPIERQKLEWAIGCVVSGDSVKVQKFLVLYGSAGTGKSTVLNIIQMLFEGYYNTFEAKALASFNNSFALEMFRDNPLVSIQHDGDLSRIEDNTKLNSIVSHEEMVVNEKRKSQYTARFNTFIFVGTNKPVTITDAKSGILRRLIDVRPSGNTVDFARYQTLMAQVKFELGAIAHHCLKVYSNLGMSAYDKYVPTEMMGATNDFYNFVEENMDILGMKGGVPLSVAWKNYKVWCEDSDVKYSKSKRIFKEELKNYFAEFKERGRDADGNQVYNLYIGFRKDKFRYSTEQEELKAALEASERLTLESEVSLFDVDCASYPAQYATADGTPSVRWDRVKTTLSDINTTELHYVKLPADHIVIDFDLKDDDGEKSLEMNLKAAAKWPKTYAELSKSGKGVHLHYKYEGDTSKLSNRYSDGIEVKVFTGNSALRRKLTRCNKEDIARLSSGLPLKKGGKKMIDFDGLKNEKALRTLIAKNLRKEIHPGTKPSVDFIYKILEDAYSSGMHYDVTDMRPDIMAFANNSTNHSYYCIKLLSNAHFQSDEPSDDVSWDDSNGIIFYDVEVFPNLFIACWKHENSDQCVKMINPAPVDIEKLCKFKLVGFNNRRYDNHILYGRMLGFSNEELYSLSKRIIGGGKEARNGYFNEAWNLSYTDIYDYASKKQGLKKWEIELGIHHQELGLPWDEPVDESLWHKVAEYCENDVRATEAVFKATYDDFSARLLLADISGLSVNETTRKHVTKIIFGNDREPQSKLVYTDLSEMFPGYSFENGKSSYRGEDPGEGGYVYAEPGYYENVALLDIASMHPSSIIALNYLGPYTPIFEEIVQARLCIKHGDRERARTMLGGKLAKFIDDPNITDKKLAYSLKIIINSIYGYTKARFDCEFKHPANVDNIVAKRGALFMIDLKHEVQERGFTVAHIKTDSIKIPNATDEIISFVEEFGKKYGYTFEHEDTYEKFCLVNNAVYICLSEREKAWKPTGAEFAVPYVFKTLFSGEEYEFSDFCETKTVSVGDIYIDMANDPSDPDLRFVGRAGLFTPILPDHGGGTLYRVADDKLYALSGTKDYEWLESEMVAVLGKKDEIDTSYYDELVDEARADIEKFVKFEKLIERSNND